MNNETKHDDTDLTDAEWAVLEPLLRRCLYGRTRKPHRHPRHYPLREILNASLYVLATGCPRRLLPNDRPPWQGVYDHFRRWQRLGIWEPIGNAWVAPSRRQAGLRALKPLAVDSQSVPSPQKGGRVGTMGARKSKGASGTEGSTRRGWWWGWW